MNYKIAVYIKNGLLDAAGEAVKKDILDLGIKNVSEVKTAQLYRIEGKISQKEIKNICKNVLIDPITQEFSLATMLRIGLPRYLRRSPRSSRGQEWLAMTPSPLTGEGWGEGRVSRDYQLNSKEMHQIEVWYKKGVTDAVAEATVSAIKNIYRWKNKNIKINTGMKYIIYGKLKKTEVVKIANRLLANNVIQEWQIVK